MNKYCVNCGFQLEDSVSFCGSCGHEIQKASNSGIKADSSVPKEESAMSDRIRTNLKGYKKHKTLTCLECGYNGLMGVTKETYSGPAFWIPVIIIILVIGMFIHIGILFGVALGLFFAVMSKAKVECPNCNQELGPV